MNVLFKDLIDKYSINLHLSEETVLEICNHLSVLHLNKKHILIKENQKHGFAYFLVKGAVRSYFLKKDGTEVNTWFAFEHEIVGSLHNFMGRIARETIELLEDSTLILIDFYKLKTLMLKNIQIAHFINAILEEYVLFLEDKIHYSQMSSAVDRYSIVLEKEPQIFQRVPLSYIASYLDMARETLSRLRAK